MRIFFSIIFILVLSCGCKSDKTVASITSGDQELDALSAEIEKNPTVADLYYQRGQKYYDKASYDNAIIDIKKAIHLDTVNPNYYHLLSDIYLDYYNSKEAVNTMITVTSMYPERVPSLLKMAELKYILEDYDASILTVNEVIRLDGQNAEGFFMLGLNFRAMADTTRAINAFQTAVEMNSGLTDAWMILSELYEAKKDPKAKICLESAIISAPGEMGPLHAKAYYLQNHGDIPGAQAIYKSIITTDKSYVDAYLNSGLLYLEVDSLDRAYEQFNLLAGVAPTNYMGFYMRGIVHEKMGKKDLALEDYESAYNLNNKDNKIEEAILSLKNQN